MTRHEFAFACHVLNLIERGEAPEVKDWFTFRSNPVRYFYGANEREAAAIWRAVEQRMAK